jgi:hypothetical protein
MAGSFNLFVVYLMTSAALYIDDKPTKDKGGLLTFKDNGVSLLSS